LEVITKSESIAPQTLIISCEACGEVRYLDAASDEEAASQFNSFRCKKGCDRSYYSYISIGQIMIGASQNPAVSDTLLPQKKTTVLQS
jgi:hypothetical protein